MPDERDHDDVTVIRSYDGPWGDYPPKGTVKEIEARYDIVTESVDQPEPGKIRVRGRSRD